MKDSTALINEVLEKIPNKYMAVIVASKRTREINDGRSALVKTGTSKPSTIALEEIAAGKVIRGEAEQRIETATETERELLPSPEESTPDTSATNASEPDTPASDAPAPEED